MRARAELICDRGEASRAAEFFRSGPFLDAEGATHSLRIEVEPDGDDRGAGVGDGPVLLAPLIVRDIPATSERDAISPYGYPGLAAAQPPTCRALPSHGSRKALHSGRGWRRSSRGRSTGAPRGWSASSCGTGSGPRPSSARPSATWSRSPTRRCRRKSRPSDRRQVRRNLEAGYEVDLVPGAETTPAQRAGFLDVYEQTMRRAEAAEHYFFGAAYFDRVLEAERTWLALATAPGGELAAASIAAVSDGYLHYYLSGSADSRLREAPMKNVLTRLVEHATDLGLPLNLGGGLRPGDALEEFKRGFANRTETWRTSELICDPEKYKQLSAGKSAGPFFPEPYRA